MVPSQYAPPPHPQYASLSQPQPPQPIFLVEQAILDLTKLVGDVMEEQKKFNAQLSQRIHTVENSLDQKLDGLQSEIDHKIDNLQTSISRLAQQHVHQEEENMEEECILGEQAQMKPQGELMQEPLKAPEEQQAGGGRGKRAGEEHQRLTLHLNPINLDPSATAQPKNNPLPVYILPATQFTPEAQAPKAKSIPSTLPVQYFKKLVAFVQTFATTSRRWQLLMLFGIVDGSGAGSDLEHPNLGISTSSTSSNSLQRPKKLVWGEHSLPHFLL